MPLIEQLLIRTGCSGSDGLFTSGPLPFFFRVCALCCSLGPAQSSAHVFSRVWLFATPWTVARQAPLSLAFPRQEYQSGLLFPSLEEIFLTHGSNPQLLHWQADSLPLNHFVNPAQLTPTPNCIRSSDLISVALFTGNSPYSPILQWDQVLAPVKLPEDSAIYGLILIWTSGSGMLRLVNVCWMGE